MVEEVAIELHHGGYLTNGPPYKYEGGIVDIVINVDPDKLSYWEVVDIVVELGYPSTSEIYYKLPNKKEEDGLVLIVDDRQVVEMIEAYRGIEMWVMYVKSGIGPINLTDQIENVNENEDGNDQNGGDNSSQFQRQNGAEQNVGNDMQEDESDNLEEESLSGPTNDAGDINSDHALMIVEPWMLEGLEGPEDDDIFALKEMSKIDLAIITSPTTIVEDIAPRGMKKGVAKKRIRKGKEIEDGNENDEFESDQRVDAIQEVNDVVDDADDFLTNKEIDDFRQLNDNGEDSERFLEFNEETDMQNPTLTVGMKFKNMQVFRDAVVEWNVRRSCDIRWIRNERKRMLAKCRRKGCDWRIFASPMQGKSTLQIKTFNSTHTCQPKFENTLVTSTYIAKRYFEMLSNNPNWKLKFMKKTVRRECKVDVGNMKLYRAKRKVADMNQGDLGIQYSKLPDYCETIKKHNPGSTCTLLLDSPRRGQVPHFKRLYMRIEALKKGFLVGCRKIIGLDGCFLKGVFGGQMLSAMGRDGNNNIYPLAWAIVEIENKDSWNWFIQLLVNDMEESKETKWTFISDRQKV